MNDLVNTKEKDPYKRSPGYVRDLWKNKDLVRRPPTEYRAMSVYVLSAAA